MRRTTDFSGLGYYTPEEMAQTLAFLTGVVLATIGALRLGFLIDFVPRAALDAFAAAASLKLIIGQLTTLLGIVGVSSMGSSFVVLANVIRYVSEAGVDAAFGLSTIAFLAIVGTLCVALAQRYPGQRRLWNFICTLRFPAVIGFSILISYLVCQDCFLGNTPFQIVGPIDPEFIALGVVNIFGPSVGGYLTTGSFGSSNILSMAGSRSQLAGVFAGLMLVIALYFLMAVFSYTPLASLAGIVIYSMFTSLPRPTTVYETWRRYPIDSAIWTISIATALAYSLEWSLYVGTILKTLLLLPRVVFAPAGKSRTEIPSPGVFVYHFGRSFCHVNQARSISLLSTYIQENTILQKPAVHLEAIVLDLDGVQNIDMDIAEGLRLLRDELNCIVETDQVKWYWVVQPNTWNSRSLVKAGFDYETHYETVEAAVVRATKSA
ncbi:hypothetical protein ACHAPE_002016 [Trichoderma viride]